MQAETRISQMGLALPTASAPVGAYRAFVQTGTLVFLSGHIARKQGKPWTGRLGEDLATGDGKAAARAATIDLLGTLRAAVGDLNRIRRLVKLAVLVNSSPDFTEQHLVANGASELLQDIFGAEAIPVRTAFGAAQIPLGACVEIDLIAEIED